MAAATMTAAQLVEPGRFDLVRVDVPTPGPGQARVTVEGCGVCASNLPAWSGRPWFQYPLAPGELGHEAWGRVADVGSGVDASMVGRRVGIISERAYAESLVADVADIIPISDALALAPLEPFGCLFNIADRARIDEGQTVAVIGLGFIGLGLARLIAQRGARVLAVSTSGAALDKARNFGAAAALHLGDRSEIAEAVADLTRGAGCARVIECTGHQAPLDLAGDLVSEGGRLIIAGYHQDGMRRVDMQQWNWKGIDVVNAHERSQGRVRLGMRAAADALAADPGWVQDLVTDTFVLDDIGCAMTRAGERPQGFVKAAVLMTESRR